MAADEAGAEATVARTATSINKVERRRAIRCFNIVFSFVVSGVSRLRLRGYPLIRNE